MGLFLCDCGGFRKATISDVTTKKVVSCGCSHYEKMITHGNSKHPLYKVWCNIKGRCYNENNPGFKHWGGKGVVLSERWKDFKTFFDDCIRLGWDEHLTIDRIDNDGNYEPGNIRFVSIQENLKNRPAVIPPGKAVVNLDTGEVFRSIRLAARTYKVSKKAITSAIERGGRCKTVRFVYAEDTNNVDLPLLRSLWKPATKKEARRKAVVNSDTGETYESISHAAAKIGVLKAGITAAIKRGGTCKGIKFAFVNNNQEPVK